VPHRASARRPFASSNATYELRADSLTGVRSYIPLMHMPPLMMSIGKPKSRGQSVCQRDGGKVPARGLAPDIDLVPVNTEMRGIVVYAGDGANGPDRRAP